MKGYTLKALRANSNLKQAEVAEKVGVSVATWSRWEKGERFPNVNQIKKIETLFNVSYNDIIFLTKNKRLNHTLN